MLYFLVDLIKTMLTSGNLCEENDMTDTTNENVENVATVEDKDSIIADLQKQIEAISNKNKELLNEKKQVSNKAKELEALREQEKMEKAKRDGDFEQLLKSSEQQRMALEGKLSELHNNITKEKLQAESLKIASDLADGANAKILARFIQERITMVDGEIRVLDANGELSVAPLDQLKQEFKASDDYKSLLRAVKSSGGNAQGGTHGSANSKVVNRAAFEKMSPNDKMSFIKNGGSVSDSA